MAFVPIAGPGTARTSGPTPSFTPLDSAPAAPVISQPSYLERGLTAVKNYAKDTADTVVPFGDKVINAVKHPLQSLVDFGNFVSAPAKQAVTQAGEAYYGLTHDDSTAKRTADAANLLSGFIGTAFSPVTGAFSLAEKTPGAKAAADLLNLPFEALGKSGSYVFGKGVDVLPISQQSKDIIKQPIQELGSTVAQIALGGKIMDKVGDLSSKGKEITPDVAHQIVEEAKSEVAAKTNLAPKPSPSFEPITEAPRVGVEGPDTLHEAPPHQAELQQYNAITDASGEVPRSVDQISADLEEAKQNASILRDAAEDHPGRGTGNLINYRTGEFTKGADEKYQDRVGQDVSNGGDIDTLLSQRDAYQRLVDQHNEAKTRVKTLQQELKTVQAASKDIRPARLERTAKSAADIESSLVEQGFDRLPAEEKASYSPAKKAEQLHFVSRLLNDIERAKAIVRGEEELPSHVLPQVFFNAMEEYATRNGDITLQKDLAKSPIASQLSHAAQTLGSHGYNDNPHSTVNVIREVVKARRGNVEKKAGDVKRATKDAVREIKREIKKSAPSRQSWESFIQEITCGY